MGRQRAEKLTAREQQAVRDARSLGLRVRFEGNRSTRVWRVFDRRTGRPLGWYQPCTTKYGLRGREGAGADWPGFVARAAGTADQEPRPAA